MFFAWLSLLVVCCGFAVSSAQTEAELLQLCNGLSFTEPFDPFQGIGQFYELINFSNETLSNIDYDCPREIWEIARNKTVFTNRQVTRNDGAMQIEDGDVGIPMKTSNHSSDHIWKVGGVNAEVFGRFSYLFAKWDNRKYVFIIGCWKTGLLQFYVLSREPYPMPIQHIERIQDQYNFKYNFTFSFEKCATVRPAACKKTFGKEIMGGNFVIYSDDSF